MTKETYCYLMFLIGKENGEVLNNFRVRGNTPENKAEYDKLMAANYKAQTELIELNKI